jgi:hypothetical protein
MRTKMEWKFSSTDVYKTETILEEEEEGEEEDDLAKIGPCNTKVSI